MLEDLDLKIGEPHGGPAKPLTATQFATQVGCCKSGQVTRACTFVKTCTQTCN